MEIKIEKETVYYLYAKKQIRLTEVTDKSIWGGKTLKTLKVDEFIKISKINNSGYSSTFVAEGIDGRVRIDNNRNCYEVLATYESALAQQEKEKAKDKSKYVIKNADGTLFKDKKYKSIKDVATALLCEWGYYHTFETSLTKENIEKNPELRSINEFPYWMGGYPRPLEELKTIEVHKYLGAKQPTEKVDHDFYTKIAKNFNNLYIALEYGLCVKELYGKMDENDEKTFQYILVYTPKDYKDYYDFSKEDELVKLATKKLKKGEFKKATKYGKTAIAFKNLNDILPFYRAFDNEANRRIKMITLDGREIVCDADAKVEIRKKIIKNIIEIGQ
jgi:hypothetical protein